jgi:hypothetical protein
LSDIHTALSDAMRHLQWAKEDSFFAANGHVFWGKRWEGDGGIGYIFRYNMWVARDAANPVELAAALNAVVAEDRSRHIAKCEADVKTARQAVLDAAA